MGQGPAERPFRVHERKPVRFVVGMSHAPIASRAHGGGGWQSEARVHDISLGGAGLEIAGRAMPVAVPSPVQQHDRVILSFIAPTLWDPLEIPARVVWIRPIPRFDAPRDPRAGAADPAGLRLGVAFEATDASKVLALFELVSTFVFDR